MTPERRTDVLSAGLSWGKGKASEGESGACRTRTYAT